MSNRVASDELTALLKFLDVHGPNIRQLRVNIRYEIPELLERAPNLEQLILATAVRIYFQLKSDSSNDRDASSTGVKLCVRSLQGSR